MRLLKTTTKKRVLEDLGFNGGITDETGFKIGLKVYGEVNGENTVSQEKQTLRRIVVIGEPKTV